MSPMNSILSLKSSYKSSIYQTHYDWYAVTLKKIDLMSLLMITFRENDHFFPKNKDSWLIPPK